MRPTTFADQHPRFREFDEFDCPGTGRCFAVNDVGLTHTRLQRTAFAFGRFVMDFRRS